MLQKTRRHNHFRCQWCGAKFADRIAFTAHKRACRTAAKQK